MSRYISCISGAALRVPALDSCVGFYTRIWGLELTERSESVARFRGTGVLAPVLSLTAAPKAEFDYFVMVARNPEAVFALAENLSACGYPLLEEPGTEFPEGKQGLATRDPDGNVIRVVGQPSVLAPLTPSIQPIGISHVAINATDGAASRRFYVEGLGFRHTDTSRNTGLEFLGCSELHHCIALLGGCKRPAVNHIAFEVRDLETFLRKAGQLVKAGCQLIGGPGRHDVGNNTFAYFADPNDWAMEVSCDMEILTDLPNWQARYWTNSTDMWGFGLSLRNEEMRKRTLE